MVGMGLLVDWSVVTFHSLLLQIAVIHAFIFVSLSTEFQCNQQ